MKFPILWCELKYICQMKGLLFWSLLLPILLSTLFSLTLSEVYEEKEEEKIRVGVVFQKGYEDEDYETDTALFSSSVLGEEQAEEYLKNGIIEGYAYIGDTCRLVVLDNGYVQMLMKSYLDDYIRLRDKDTMLVDKYQQLTKSAAQVRIEEKSGQEINSAVSHYDTILATACLCAVFSGLMIVFRVRHPEQAPAAIRYQIAPKRSFWIICRRFFLAWLLQIIFVTLSYFYMLFVLAIPFHMNIGYVLLIHIVGILVSMLFGVFIGLGDRLLLSAKLGITTAVIIVCAYFSGLMDIHVRASVQERLPFMHFINPCTLMTDAYYALYQWNPEAFVQSLAALLVIGLLSVLLIVLYTGEGRHEAV